ncbi:MAG: 50S ribosomal protein L21 [Firmicutes bacterium]|nr:50S ribosomal protein L21 [Bacillota bacterium]
MYAIVSTGGKQYKVAEMDLIIVEKLDAEVGATVKLDVLMLNGKVGTPLVAGAAVTAKVIEHGKGDKLYIRTYKKMNGHHRAAGHRQPYTKLEIISIK